MDDHIYTNTNYFEEFEESTVDEIIEKTKVVYTSFWTNENVKKLIKAVKAQPVIWHSDNKGFKSLARREAAWQRVSDYFCEEIDDPNRLVAKWQSLRCQYRRSQHNVKHFDEKPVWKFHYQMSFIDNEEIKESVNEDATSNQDFIQNHTFKYKPMRGLNRKIIDIAFWRKEQNVVKLIKAVRKRKSLWDCNEESYKNRTMRQLAWQAVRKQFKNRLPVSQLAAKWQNLRTIYRRIRKKQEGLTEMPYWKYYASLSFLHDNEQSGAEEGEENFEIESSIENQQFDTVNNEILTKSGDHDIEHNEEMLSKNNTSQKTETDNVDNFSKFFASELRKIKNNAYRETTQRKVLQFLWQCMDEEKQL